MYVTFIEVINSIEIVVRVKELHKIFPLVFAIKQSYLFLAISISTKNYIGPPKNVLILF